MPPSTTVRWNEAFCTRNSYTGNPLACRAALATLELFDQLDALEANQAVGRALEEALLPLAHHPRVRHARRTGMIWAWDVVDAPPDFAARYHRQALARGLLLRPIGSTLYAMPPYVLQPEEVRHLGDAAFGALQATLDEPAA